MLPHDPMIAARDAIHKHPLPLAPSFTSEPLPTPTRIADPAICDKCLLEHHGKGCNLRPGRNAGRNSNRCPAPIRSIDGEAFDGIYALLATETDELYNPNGLSSEDIFRWLLNLPHGRYFGFFLGYDINWWLRDLGRRPLTQLAKSNKTSWQGWTIRHIPSKKFTITHNKSKRSRTIWDAGHWANTSFVRWVETWNAATESELETLRYWKAERANFTFNDVEGVRAYNQLELKLLTICVSELLDSLRRIGVVPRQYFGPGSASSAMLTDKFNGVLPVASEPFYVRSLYYGGRFETSILGRYEGPIYSYDINSAYPYALSLLPCFQHGEWLEHRSIDLIDQRSDWTIWGIRKARVPDGSPYGPYPIRVTGNSSLQYPLSIHPMPGGERGIRFVWGYEREAAKLLPGYRDNAFPIMTWVPSCTHSPFAFIAEAYEARRNSTDAGEKYAYKLTLNSMYGKLAQQVGGGGRWTSFTLASLITAKARAMLLEAVSQNPNAILMLATDGLLSTAKLNLPTGTDIGQWDYVEYGATLVAQAGVYWLYDTNGFIERGKSRGFGYSALNPDEIYKCWLEDKPYRTTQRMFVGYRQALTSNAVWRSWPDMDKVLMIRPEPRRLRGERLETYERTIALPHPTTYPPSVFPAVLWDDIKGAIWDQPDWED